MPYKPKFGQNFLVDDAARQQIADALGDVSDRLVIEIGPGHGAITSILAARCRRLIAIELDPALSTELHLHFRNAFNVKVLEADILKTDIAALVPLDQTADVVGNLPTTSPRTFCSRSSPPLAARPTQPRAAHWPAPSS